MVVSSYIYREYWHMFLYIRNSAHKLSVKLITMAKLEVFSEGISHTIIVEQNSTEAHVHGITFGFMYPACNQISQTTSY